ncbi:hypothetical protein [Rubricoccus marinus]|nr:hypothetical protein [Rubricoccus marinus]
MLALVVLVGCDTASDPPTPSRLEPISSDYQSLIVETLRQTSLTARVVSELGAGVEGVAVSFQVTSGDAEMLQETVMTDLDGHAVALLRAGSDVGEITVRATTSVLPGADVTFLLTARVPSDILVKLRAEIGSLELDRERGLLYATLTHVNELVVISAEDGTVVRRISLPNPAGRVHLNATGERLYVGVRDGTVRVFDAETLVQLHSVSVQSWTGDERTYDVVEVAQDRIAVTANPRSEGSSYVGLVDFSTTPVTGVRLAPLEMIRFNPKLQLSPDRTRFYVSDYLTAMFVFTLGDTPAFSRKIRHPGLWIRDYSLSTDGSRLHYWGGQVLDSKTLEVVGMIDEGIPAVDPASDLVYVAGSSGVSSYRGLEKQGRTEISLPTPQDHQVWVERGAAYVLACPLRSCTTIFSVSIK